MMFELGFYEETQAYPELIERIKGLQHQKSSVSSLKAFKSDHGDCRMYIAEYKTGSKDAAFKRVAIMVSSHLELPRISLMPKPKLSGFLGSIVTGFLVKLVKRNLTEVIFNHYPEFNTRYFTFGDNPGKVQYVMPDSLLSRLCRSEHYYQIEGKGDTLAISLMAPNGREFDNHMDTEKWRIFIDDAYDVYRHFRISERRTVRVS
jgi:hypothetical protein